MHPNSPPPGDSALVDSSRSAAFDRAAYSDWLRRLREVCHERGIVFLLDDIFCGFRLAPGGSQEYFGVKADMVTYGKTLGGGLPVGVICGRRELMKRYRDDRPVDISLARGTFNSHPYVMGAMHEFLLHMEKPEAKALYAGLDETWNAQGRRDSTSGWRPSPFRCAWPTCRPCGRSSIRARRATTGCSSTTCAARGWR